MKFVVILIVICASQTSASFFEEFQGAMYSVQDSFGRLITDVYTDVSQTIGCTILAVKQVLALDQSFHESSDYNRRCRGQEPPPFIIEVPRMDKDNMAYSYIDNINANHELDNIETEFKTETDRLLAISALLRREVDNIPKEIKFDFRIEPEPQEPIGSIWQSLKILHDVEHSNKNYIRANKIHQVLDKAIHLMNIKTTNENESDNDKIKNIVKDLEKSSNAELTEAEKQLGEWKEEEVKEKVGSKAPDTKNINTDENESDIIKLKTISSDLERDAKDVLSKADDKFEEWKEEQLKSVGIDLNKRNITDANAQESNVVKIKTLVNNLESDTKDVLTKADEQFKEWKEEELKKIEIEGLNIVNEKATEANESDVNKIKTIVKTLESDSKDALIKADEQFKEWKEKEYKDVGITDIKEMNIKPTNNIGKSVDEIKSFVKDLENNAKDALIQVDEEFKDKQLKDVMNDFGLATLKDLKIRNNTSDTNKPIDNTVKDLKNNSIKVEADGKFQQRNENELKKEVAISNIANNGQQINHRLIKTTDKILTTPSNIEASQGNKFTQEATTASPVKTTTLSPELEAFQNVILSQFGSQDEDPEKAAEEATRLIQDSVLRNKVFDSLAKAESASTDLFDNPDLFVNNFGKY